MLGTISMFVGTLFFSSLFWLWRTCSRTGHFAALTNTRYICICVSH